MPLQPRGAYHLTGEARHDWEHSIAEMDRPRWSVTFRSLAAQELSERIRSGLQLLRTGPRIRGPGRHDATVARAAPQRHMPRICAAMSMRGPVAGRIGDPAVGLPGQLT